MDTSEIEDLPMEDVAALSSTFTSQPTRFVLGNFLETEATQLQFQPSLELPKRQIYTKEQWDARKEDIRRLYNVNNLPFKTVLDILRSKHDFFPTYVLPVLYHSISYIVNCTYMETDRKRQFFRKITEWGFEKNIKKDEARAILRGLTCRKNLENDGPVEVRGRDVGPAKLRRWKRRYGRLENGTCAFSNSPGMGKNFGTLEMNVTLTNWMQFLRQIYTSIILVGVKTQRLH